MFFATTTPTNFQRQFFVPAARSLERWLDTAQCANRPASCSVSQDDGSYTLTLDVPGVARDQLNIGIEGNVVRVECQPGAPREYQHVCELPQDIDVASSDAKLENGVLTLKLVKLVPVSKATKLTVN